MTARPCITGTVENQEHDLLSRWLSALGVPNWDTIRQTLAAAENSDDAPAAIARTALTLANATHPDNTERASEHALASLLRLILPSASRPACAGGPAKDNHRGSIRRKSTAIHRALIAARKGDVRAQRCSVRGHEDSDVEPPRPAVPRLQPNWESPDVRSPEGTAIPLPDQATARFPDLESPLDDGGCMLGPVGLVSVFDDADASCPCSPREVAETTRFSGHRHLDLDGDGDSLSGDGSIADDNDDGTLGDINQYVLLDRLGKGSQGEVFLAMDTEKNELRAVKAVQRPAHGSPLNAARRRRLADVAREVNVMKRLRHRNIVALHEVIDDPAHDAMYLVLQYVEHGPL
eukprot:CAMPEP_0174851736 /NCGR_PEP_ID=MMETSP1114-20130205/23641_1 /TAXON_ID=312471 /ORGANISM="Neobodo designis, Strain CCAP 1951/1" /LENGTH=347 /DNA_ID=CAMNT_0016086291 /DNA_START=207 /DNA_END=1246 /DNA_ORIENTATION=+